jgi:hypothetical protein
MTDHFALLDEPRRPWLETVKLKEKFFALSSSVHPDRVHGESADAQAAAQRRFTALNAAFTCLREPKDRLRHLLELETGARPGAIQPVPETMMNLFFEVGKACRAADTFLAAKPAAISPMLQVERFTQAQTMADRLLGLQRQLAAQQEAVTDSLRSLNEAWALAPPPGDARRAAALGLPEIERAAQTLSYLTRWLAQMQERVVQLAL